MPVLSAFISTYTKRKNRPLAGTSFRHLRNTSSSANSYTPPPVIDINDGRPKVEPNGELVGTEKLVIPDRPITPPMKLDLEFNNEPLTQLFPVNFLKRETVVLAPKSRVESSTKLQPIQDVGIGHSHEGNVSMEDDEDDYDDLETASSSEAVLANLQAMDVCHQLPSSV